MSLPINGNVIGGFSDTLQVGFTAANGTLAKVLADVTPASGNYTGGQRVYDIIATSTSGADNSLIVWDGVQLSLYANMGVVNTTATTNATVTRTVGSYLTDGWKIGDSAMCFGSVGASNNGNVAIVTNVTALTLTFSGVPAGFSANVEGVGFRLIRVTRRAWTLVPANSGDATSVSALLPNVQLCASSNDLTLDSLGIELASNSLLLIACYQAVAALPAVIQVAAKAALR